MIGDKGYTSRDFHAAMTARHALIIRPDAKTSPVTDPTWPRSANASSRSSRHSKTLFTLERHGARTLHGLRTRISQRLLALTAGIALNHQLNRPTRNLIAYNA